MTQQHNDRTPARQTPDDADRAETRAMIDDEVRKLGGRLSAMAGLVNVGLEPAALDADLACKVAPLVTVNYLGRIADRLDDIAASLGRIAREARRKKRKR